MSRENTQTGPPVYQPRSDVLPAAFAPFVDVGLLFTECRVVAMTGVEPRVVRQYVKDPGGHVIDQRGEVLGRSRATDAAGEQSIASAVNTVRVTTTREVLVGG
jgi:hypothetical protein